MAFCNGEEGTVSIFYPEEGDSNFSEMLVHMYQRV
jgi:hypothetical protein